MKANNHTTFIDGNPIINLASGGVGSGELPWTTKGDITSTIGARESANITA